MHIDKSRGDEFSGGIDNPGGPVAGFGRLVGNLSLFGNISDNAVFNDNIPDTVYVARIDDVTAVDDYLHYLYLLILILLLILLLIFII